MREMPMVQAQSQSKALTLAQILPAGAAAQQLPRLLL